MSIATPQQRKISELKCIWKKSATTQGEYYALHFSSVQHIPSANWKALVQDHNTFLSLEYLSALEDAHDSGLELRYVMFQNNNMEYVGLAAFQITHFTTGADAYSNWLLKRLNQLTQYLRKGHVHNILICGNAIATGEHGFYFNTTASQANQAALDAGEQVRLVLDAMFHISAQEKKRGKPICAMVAKDFYPHSAAITQALDQRSFTTFQVDHNMVMPVLPSWKTFDHYLAALNTKFRTKAKAAFKKSIQLKVVTMTHSDILQHAPRMQQLYENVYQRADFRLGKMSTQSLATMLQNMPKSFFVTGLFLHHQLVGFCSAMQSADTLEAHIIGIDYECNKEHSVYQRMLYKYIELAIETGCVRIVFGRTAAEIKSTIGAMPVDLSCSIYHPRKISNALLTLILNYVKPSEYPHRHPWRAELQEEIQNIALY